MSAIRRKQGGGQHVVEKALLIVAAAVAVIGVLNAFGHVVKGASDRAVVEFYVPK